MRRCPHCQSLSLPWLTLALSTESSPVRCTECKGLSHRDTGIPLLLGVLSLPGLLGAGAAALHLQTWWPIVLFFTIIVLASSLSLLLPATRTTPVKAPRFQAIAIAVVLAIAAASVVAILCMFLDYLVAPAFAVAVISMVVLFATRRRFPRVADVASALMTVGLGILFLWGAAHMITTGVSEGQATTMFKRTVQRSESPAAFWTRVAVIGVPALLLLGVPLVVAVKFLLARFVRGNRESRRGPPHRTNPLDPL